LRATLITLCPCRGFRY